MIRFTKGLAAACLTAGGFITLTSSASHAWIVDCKAFGQSGFSGTVTVAEDSARDQQAKGAKADVALNVSWVDRTEGKDPGPYHDTFHGALDGNVRTFAAGELTVGESKLLSVHNGQGEEKAALKVLVGLKRKNATFTYKGLIFEALCE